LYHQIRSQEYDCLANLAILKLYQFNPHLYNPDVVVNILIKALTSLSPPDFNLCLALLSERPLAASLEEPDPIPSLLPSLTELHALLQQCRFPRFWELYRSDDLELLRDNYTVEVAGFEECVREIVIKGVRATFQRIGGARLGSYLALGDADLPSYVSKVGWSLDTASGVVTIPPNPDNRIESTVVREIVQLPQLSKIISHAAHAN